MIIENVVSSVWSTLPGPSCHTSRLRPPTFNPFAVHPSCPLCVCEVEHDLTTAPVSGEMELGDGDLSVIQVGQLEGGRLIFVQANLKIFVPLAANVVGDKEVGNPSVY